MRRLLWLLVPLALLVVWLTPVRAVYVLAPLLGLAIWQIGVASLGSFRRGAAHIPSGDPIPVDTQQERTSYWCQGCGTVVLLLVRGTEAPPRHCGERMAERREIARGEPLD